MKHNLRFIAGSFALLLGVTAQGYGGVPSMDVTVFDTSGNVAFAGATTDDATFATPRLQPGQYVVQFKTQSAEAKGNQYLAVLSAGKRKVVATAVRGETFMGGGAAMKINVASPCKITGQIANEQTMLAEGGANYRIVGGRRFVWVTGQLGSNLGGHWVEEGAPPAQNVVRVALETVRRIQEQAGEGNLINYAQRRMNGF